MKADGEFNLFVLSASLKIDSAAIKRHLGVKKLRFATPEELFSMTTLVPGCIPPFGEPVFPFPIFVDPSITQNSKIAFNAGSLTNSIVMPMEDYLRIAKPAMFNFALNTE